MNMAREHPVRGEHGPQTPPGHDGYIGPATLELELGQTAVSVSCGVVITGSFEPITGRYRWYGRAHGPGLGLLPAKGVLLRTPHGRAETTLGDVDLWGRYRLQGFGRPPFPVATRYLIPGDPLRGAPGVALSGR